MSPGQSLQLNSTQLLILRREEATERDPVRDHREPHKAALGASRVGTQRGRRSGNVDPLSALWATQIREKSCILW